MRLAIIAIIAQFLFASVAWAAPNVVVLTMKGSIGPAMQDYFHHGLNQAIAQNASAVILTLDTPGGLETSMRAINNQILSSPIPVIAYVAPTGARAMSAGTYIMYASHIAAMADGTTLGAATPIELGVPYVEYKNSLSTRQQKMMQDATAYIKSLANLRGRNAEWAVDAVLNAAAITAADAKHLKVIDILANDYSILINELQNKEVNVQGKMQSLQLEHATLTYIEPGWRFELLNWITDPNIAYLLLLLAIYAIVIELSHPGLILPGATGLVSLIVALYAFQLMPLNYAGFSLLLMGIACMIAEVFASTMGALALTGLIAFIGGSLMLFDSAQSEYRVALSVIMTMAILSGSIFLFLIGYLIKAQRRKVITGSEAILYKEGVVESNHQGKLIVKIMGDRWNAKSAVELHKGVAIRVIAIEGIVLIVEPVKLSSGE